MFKMSQKPLGPMFVTTVCTVVASVLPLATSNVYFDLFGREQGLSVTNSSEEQSP